MSDTKKKVKDKFYAFLKATSLGPDMHRNHTHLGQSYGRNCLLLGWDHQPFAEAIRVVSEIYPNVSDRTIGEVLSRSMVKLFNQSNVSENADPEANAPIMESIMPTLEPSAVNKEVDEFIDVLKSKVKARSTYIFVEGLELKDLTELSLGAFTLYPKDEGPLHNALEKLRNSKHWTTYTQSIEANTSHCHCYLTIDLEGEERFVNQEAFHRAEDIINVLNLYITSTRHRDAFYQRVGVLGQPTTSHRQICFMQTPPFGDDSTSPPYYSYFEQFPPGKIFEIDSTHLEQWKENGFNKVVESFQRIDAKAGTVESRIRNAAIWYGRAINAYTYDEQFVGLTTALESLLVGDEDIKNITQRLADAVSALLGGDFQNREYIKKETKELYSLRSDIVHHGKPVSQESLFALDDIIANTILAFARKEIL